MSESNFPVIVIGLCGKFGSGKDTAADYLVDKYKFTKLSIASHVRRELLKVSANPPSRLFPASMRKLCEMSANERYATIYNKPTSELGRACLQWYGLFRRESAGEMHWLSQVICQIRDSSKSRFVITDIRYKNEADYASRVGVLWRIHKDEIADSNTRYHQSETELERYSKVALTIGNNGTIEELHGSVDLALSCHYSEDLV